MDRVCSYDNDIILYFCFLARGVDVAMRPGDIIMFNPSEPHAVSSRCQREDKIFVASYYLKTAVVGGNDNSIALTDMQSKVYKQIN